jgi:hypothetical protein
LKKVGTPPHRLQYVDKAKRTPICPTFIPIRPICYKKDPIRWPDNLFNVWAVYVQYVTRCVKYWETYRTYSVIFWTHVPLIRPINYTISPIFYSTI